MEREHSSDRAWRSSAEVWPGAIARVLALALVLAGPWLSSGFGLDAILWLPALVILVCWILTPELTDRGVVSVPTLLLPAAAAALLGIMQLVPLPSGALGVLSPAGQHWWGLVDLAASAPDPSGLELSSKHTNHPISLYPWAAKQSLAALVFAAVFLLAGARFFRRVEPFAWLNAGLAVTALGLPLAVWSLKVEPIPLVVLAVAASLGLLFSRGSVRNVLGIVGLVGCGVTLLVLWRQENHAHLWFVPAAGFAAVVGGWLLSHLPGRRATVPALLVAAAASPWVIGSTSFQIPATWMPFLKVGSGFGSAVLLRTDRPPLDPAPASFVARLMVEGGWLAVVAAAVAFWLFARALVMLMEARDRDTRGFVAAGLFFGPAAVAWLGIGESISAPVPLLSTALFVGAIVGRAALAGNAALSPAAFALPKTLPVPTFGTLLLAASLWAASVAWAAERTREALEASTLKPQQMTLAEVDAALLRLRPLVHHGDALALWRLAERRIDRFRLQTAEQLATQLKLTPQQAWRRSDPSEIFARANAWRRAKQSAQLEALRREAPVAQNLEQALAELRAALAASPLVSEIALRNAQLRFASDVPVNESALLQLAGERAAPYPDLLYAIGLEEYFVDRVDRAAELWKATLQLSFDKLVPICRLLGAKMSAARLLDQVLPNHPEAYLTFAELLANDERNSLPKVAALEHAKRSLAAAALTDAQRDFHRGRWHAGVGEWKAAVDALLSAVKQDPGNVRFRLALVSALEHKGDRAAALIEARRGLETQPADAELKAAIERLTKPAPQPTPSPPKQPPKKQ